MIRDQGASKPQTCKLADLSAVACCGLFAVCLVWRPLVAGEAFHWGTPLLQFVPWQRLAAEMWRSGDVPLWNPLVGCGAPLAANYQTAAFYPLNALYLLLPAETALGWTVALHLVLAGLGMYAWGRTVGLERFPALVAGLAVEGSGFLVAHAALFPSMAVTFPWVAVWLWRGEVLARRGRFRDALWLGAALGMGLLAGHAQTAFYGGLLLAAYCVFRVSYLLSRHWRSFIARCSLFLVSLVIGIGLAAVQLLPTAELMWNSQRAGGVDYDRAATYSFWPWRLLTFFAPDFFGNPGRGEYWGYATYWEDAGYVGVLPLLLALGAIAQWGKGTRPGDVQQQRGFWVGCVIVGLALALGKYTPLFPFLFRHVPTFDLFQAPARWLAVVTVALAALSGIGAQHWPVGKTGRRWGMAWLIIGAACAIGGMVAPRLIAGERMMTFGTATLRFGVTLAVAGGLALWQTGVRPQPVWMHGVLLWQAAVLTFVGLDLLLFGRPLVPSVERALYRGKTERVALAPRPSAGRVYWPADPDHPRSEYDAEYRVKFRYLTLSDFGPRDAAYWRGMREALLPNAGMLDGIASANNFDPLLVSRYTEMLAALPDSPNLLRVMGVTHVVSDRPWSGGEPVHTSADTTLYRLPDSPGRAWIVPSARRVPAGEMLAALADPAFDPTAEVLLEVSPLIPSPYSLVPNPYSLSLHDTPNGVTIRAALDAPGYLVLADTWYPGWQAKIDGQPAEILRANYAFRATYLEAGDHTVEMVYRPQSFIVGASVTGVTGVGWFASLFIGWLVGWLRRRSE